jgi:DNA-binding SARP family transcriptional activator/TolB-like protein
MLRLTTLGSLDLRDADGQPVRELLAQPKRLALLVFLAIESANEPVSRDRVLAMFWPESTDTQARNALSQGVYQLRQLLGAETLLSIGTALGVERERLWCDAVALSEASALGNPDAALDLWRGPCCSTLFVSGTPEFERWLDGVRARQRRELLAAARAGAEALRAAGDIEGAARLAHRILALHPDDERDVSAYLEILDASGDVVGALRAYERHVAQLREVLDTAPAPETQRVAREIRDRHARASATSREPRDDARARSANWVPETVANRTSAPTTAPIGHRETLAGPVARERWIPRMAAALIIAPIVIGLLAVRSRHDTRAAAAPRTHAVAILPFTVRGGGDLAYLHDGMSDLLSAKFDGAAGVRAIDPRSVVAATTRAPSAPAEQTARALGADWYVLGDVIAAGGRLNVTGSLYTTDGGATARATASVTGDTAAIFDIVDDLAGRLLAGVVPGSDTTLTRLAALTTHSLPALKAFLRGEQALRAGLDAEAAAAFREAAHLDTTFALAEYRLSMAATWTPVPGGDDPAVWADAAARHGTRLTPLARDLLEAYRVYREPDSRAEALYAAVVASHPDNVEAWFMLAESRFHYGPWTGRSPSASKAAFERVLALDPINSHALVHLVRLAAADGQLAALDSLAERYLRANAETPRALEVRALLAWCHRDSAGAREVARQAVGADELVVSSLINAAVSYAQDADAIRLVAEPVMRMSSQSMVVPAGRRILSDAALGLGQWDPAAARAMTGRAFDADWWLESAALAAAEPALGVPLERVAALRDSVAARRPYPATARAGRTMPAAAGAAMRAYLLALLSLRLGDQVRVEAEGRALHAVADRAGPHDGAVLESALRAERLRAAGKPEAALTELGRVPFAVTAASFGHLATRERFALAELLHALGRDDEALAVYDAMQAYSDLPFMATARWRQAQIHERAGRRERAIFNYQRVTQMWRDADPPFQPRVADARAALERLGATAAGTLAERRGSR